MSEETLSVFNLVEERNLIVVNISIFYISRQCHPLSTDFFGKNPLFRYKLLLKSAKTRRQRSLSRQVLCPGAPSTFLAPLAGSRRIRQRATSWLD